MKLFGYDFGNRKKVAESAAELRDSPENASIPVSAENFMQFFGIQSANLPSVSIDSALSVPAVWAAVSFLSRTLAAVPLHAYRNTKDGPKRLGGKIESVIHDFPNDGMDSFKFRQYFWQQVFTGGRGLAYIERTPQGVDSLWPMDPTKTTIQRSGMRVTYHFENKEYQAADVIDVPFMLKPNGLRHYGPIDMAAKAIQLAIAMNDYGSNFFASGGVPPLALTGPMAAGAEAFNRQMGDVQRAVDAAKKSQKPVVIAGIA